MKITESTTKILINGSSLVTKCLTRMSKLINVEGLSNKYNDNFR